MRPLLCALAGLALLRAAGAFAAAEPFIPSHGDPARATGCDKHMAIHSRLDVLEEVMRVTWEDIQLQDHLPGGWLWRVQANLAMEN
ncbi:Placenta-specific protein 9 [Camelus dromedarius]|uniref:Placenta-specific protein 9 n=1 Tax=Camelus dromedarius TaxID=9838 RepID=A0A5N4DJH3_CAMDR|nr:placenta-specific protein 9-like [Camelus dromedarius]KAB1271302.1 Placenta-specific protein 9 [Camelus dromedarius]